MTRVFGMLFGCAIAAGLLAVGLWLAPGVKIPDEATTRAAVAPDATIPEPALQPAPPPPAAEVEEAEGPEVDILRVERDGATLVSGRATPGAEVEILLGEGTAGVAAADAQGNFVAFLTLPESDAPQSLNVRERDAEGTARPGTRNFVVETRRPAPNGLQREAAASNAEIAAARPKDEAAAVSAADVPTDTPSVPTPEVAPADDARNPSRVSLAGDAAAPQPIAPLGRSTTETQPPNSPRAARDIVAGDRPDAPDPSTEIAAASPVPHAEDAPVSTDRPDPPRAGDKSRRPAEIGIPPVQVALPQAEGAPANVPADGEMLMTRTNSPTVVDAPVQPEAPRVLRVENGSLSVVQDGAPQPALSIDTIRYAPGGTVVLGGRAPQTSSVRAYLDNRPLDAVRSGSDGQWRLDLPTLEERTYSLRVDQLNAEGEVVARAETPFRPESAASLDALRGLVEDGVRRVTVQPGFTLWAIAERNYGDGLSFVRVFEANADKIRNPDLIYPGQIFAVPD